MPAVRQYGPKCWWNWFCCLNRWIKWVVRGVPLQPGLTGSQKWAWCVGPACVCLCKTWGLTKPTCSCIGSICYYCSCSAAADVTSCGSAFMKELRIMCSISFQYILLRTPLISREASREQSERSESCQLSLSLSSTLFCLSCSPACPPLPWEFIHPQPPQEMIVFFAFRVAVCVTENYKIPTASWTGGI